MKEIIERLTSRKFLMTVAALLAIFLVDKGEALNDLAGRIADLSASVLIVLGYGATNVAEKKAEK